MQRRQHNENITKILVSLLRLSGVLHIRIKKIYEKIPTRLKDNENIR